MIEIRPFEKLGGENHGWLDAKHHFSFANYHDPNRIHWGSLRVWNDDTVQAKSGFPPHPHRDMEIITYVRKGAVTHQDSLGNQGRTEAGDVQVMSAGTGITHAEYNMEDEVTQLFQIWSLPDQSGGQPTWGARPFPRDDRAGRFATLAAGMANGNDALPIRTNARVAGATIKAGETVRYALGEGRSAYLVSATGKIEVNGVEANARDGVAIRDEAEIAVTAIEDSEVVLVDAA